MQHTDENKALIGEKLVILRNLPGFPKDSSALERAVEDVLDVCHGKTLGEMIPDEKPTDAPPELPPIKRPGPASMMDYEWLIEMIRQHCDRFPTTSRIREAYGTYFTPAKTYPVAPIFIDRLRGVEA